MIDGSLTVGNTAYVAYSGIGTFAQSGGTCDVSGMGSLYLGYGTGGSGSYSLSGTGQLSAYSQYVGYYGMAALTQYGGSNTASGLCLGLYSGASGTYSLSGTGQLCAGGESIGASGAGPSHTAAVPTLSPVLLRRLWVRRQRSV